MTFFSTLLLTALPPVPVQPVAIEPLGAAIAPVPAVFQDTTAGNETLAGNFKYTFAELDFCGRYDNDSNAEAAGLHIRGSYAFENVQSGFLRKTFVLASLSRLDDEVEFDEWEVGGGYVHPVNDKLDLVGTFSLLHQEIDAGAADDDETGFEIAGGGRMWVAAQIEVDGRLIYRDVFDDDLGLGIGGRYHANPQLSLGADVELIGDIEEYRVGIRWSF
jgi:hypothetical protein